MVIMFKISPFRFSLVRLSLGSYCFQARLFPTIITLLLLPLLIFLGCWQLQRAAFKQQLQTHFASQLKAQPISIHQAMQKFQQDPQTLAYSPLKITGYYDNSHSILLDNKIQNHRVGYQVLTPFVLENKQIILVNRGWIPRENKPLLPPIDSSKRNLNGWIYVPPSHFFALGQNYTAQGAWPVVMQNPKINDIETVLQQPVFPFLMLLSPTDPSGFVRDWQPVSTPFGAEKHRGYAVQWFGLALTLLIIYIVVNIRRTPQTDRKTYEN
jgi:surfeit locus 1 family protein